MWGGVEGGERERERKGGRCITEFLTIETCLFVFVVDFNMLSVLYNPPLPPSHAYQGELRGELKYGSQLMLTREDTGRGQSTPISVLSRGRTLLMEFMLTCAIPMTRNNEGSIPRHGSL